MTFRGWIGYLQCFFSKHKLRSLRKRRGRTEHYCDRCSRPDAYTLRSWFWCQRQRLKVWWEVRTDKHDDHPF